MPTFITSSRVQTRTWPLRFAVLVDWRAVPRFGTPSDGLPVVVRPSAYAFILNENGLLAIVRAPDGVFLPGGGVEQGESFEAAVARETLEECGLVIRTGRCVLEAVQFASSSAEGACFEKQSRFFDAAVEGEAPSAIIDGHETLWLAPSVADQVVSHESQAWAIQQWRRLNRRAATAPEV